jgi:hypothetical protein
MGVEGAQVYGHLHQGEQSAAYCVRTLNLQLAHVGSSTNVFDHADWAQNAAQLCGYFLAASDYRSADRCLAAAQWVLDDYGRKGYSGVC